jgi:CspA family cold shock protein
MYDRRPGFFRYDDGSTAHRRVDATVKWLDAAKGFGFVAPNDGSPDAFLPMAVLRRAGCDHAREGAAIVCEIGTGAKGPLVVNVLHIDNTAAAAPAPAPARPTRTLQGAVKWYEPDKGYGFIEPDGGGKDIFVHVNALLRSGVTTLFFGQRVRVDVTGGRRGLEAERITLI